MNPEQTMPDNALTTSLSTSSLPKTRNKKFSWRVFLGLLILGLMLVGAAYQYQENGKLQRMLEQQRLALLQMQRMDINALDENRRLQLAMASRLSEIEKTTQMMSAVYQNMNNNEVQRLLADTEHTLILASEAMYISNDISSALKLLQYADSKIQAVSHPELVKLHAALQMDIQTLAALPQIDMAMEMARIDTVINGINSLPLNIDIQRTIIDKKPVVATVSELPWWRAVVQDIWSDLKSLVSIRRLDKPDQALLTADQVILLQENMKLHMVSARIALMTRNQPAYLADLRTVQKYLRNFFDQQQARTKQFTNLLQKLSKVQFVNDKPIFTSLSVLRNTPLPFVAKGECR